MTKKIDSTDENWDNRVLGSDEKYAGDVKTVVFDAVMASSGTEVLQIRFTDSLLKMIREDAVSKGLSDHVLIKQILSLHYSDAYQGS